MLTVKIESTEVDGVPIEPMVSVQVPSIGRVVVLQEYAAGRPHAGLIDLVLRPGDPYSGIVSDGITYAYKGVDCNSWRWPEQVPPVSIPQSQVR